MRNDRWWMLISRATTATTIIMCCQCVCVCVCKNKANRLSTTNTCRVLWPVLTYNWFVVVVVICFSIWLCANFICRCCCCCCFVLFVSQKSWLAKVLALLPSGWGHTQEFKSSNTRARLHTHAHTFTHSKVKQFTQFMNDRQSLRLLTNTNKRAHTHTHAPLIHTFTPSLI